MNTLQKATALVFLAAILAAVTVQSEEQTTEPHNYLLGAGIADITGPALGIQLWGFSRDGQVSEGIHTRQKSRAFIISEPEGDKRVVFVSADIGSIVQEITLEVIDRLQLLFGDVYSLDNVILSATHTHAAPAGYWHTRSDESIAGDYHQEYFDHIVDGIVKSIATAHRGLQPGTILINTGDVERAGINRSLIAYEENPEQERVNYPSSIDKEMTLLKLSSDSRDIGMLNWHAVHPTSMTYYNKLISGDHKGYASLAFERLKNEGREGDNVLVGAFAQANAGDVTPNLNLDNTGPGADDFASTKIIGDRQLAIALELFDSASEVVEGKIDYRQVYVDLSAYEVQDEFTHAGTQHTCPSAYGYSFAGGSTEDGGGHFLFEEGMTSQNFILDFLIKTISGSEPYTEAVRECQRPKPILWETGTGNPPMQSQIRSVSVIRIGQLVILATPAEVATMAGRRLRHTVMAQLGDWAKHIVLAGYSNGYAGYVITREEYQLQQYEGGHTLHGQWSLPAYQQVSAQLASALENGTAVTQTTEYDDWRGKSTSVPLRRDTPNNVDPSIKFGEPLPQKKTHYAKSDTVSAKFWSSNPTNNFGLDDKFLLIERKQDNAWITVFTDHDWSTKIRWEEDSGAHIAEVIWAIPDAVESGEYRIRHFGHYDDGNGKQQSFVGASQSLTIE
jgi:neutral ceramidase